MAWEEIDFNKPHLAYMIIGGFTSLFMLCSLFIKEKLYIGEATVATLVGVIFGPHAANLFNPLTWGNTDQITLELSRIVLVVQCFAVGVELPKAYMERHWRSVTFLLVPVMTFGWLITSLIIWVAIAPLSWLEALAIAACVTATDPVLASSVVGKGKFAKRVPKHLRDVLSAESGCNDGMAFPFIYLAYYLIHYHLDAGETTFHWIVLLILYECIFGAVYGFIVGYIGRHAIKAAERHRLIDRDSFLVFYFVLALFCAGSASGLGLDDLLVGFSAGVGFSNDGWFVEKTEESHVSNVIDLLLNLAYFVYLGSIIPWQDYNAPDIGITPWRLVVIGILVVLFRRIPAMLALKPLIPDIKNWREALFAGHFGPIGVGAIFAVILLRAELENGTTIPDEDVPTDGPNLLVIQTMWPIVTFLVICSILVHGSSIAVFTLGKRINTLTLTMSYTGEQEPTWMDRLPRIASRGRSMSKGSQVSQEAASSPDEKGLEFQPGTLGPIGLPRNFLRRQKEEESGSRPGSRPQSRKPRSRKKTYDAGGPVSESAIAPVWRREQEEKDMEQDIERAEDEGDEGEPPDMVEADAKHLGDMRERDNERPTEKTSPELEAYREGDEMIVEDEEGNVLETRNIRGESPEDIRQDLLLDRNNLRKETSGEHAKSRHHPHEQATVGEELEKKISSGLSPSTELPSHAEYPERPQQAWRKWMHHGRNADEPSKEKAHKEKPKPVPHRGAAQAYQYGNKIIVEDADGEVVKTYNIPREKQKHEGQGGERPPMRRGLTRMSTWTGLAKKDTKADAREGPSDTEKPPGGPKPEEDDDRTVRFRLGGSDRRMSKQDFIRQIQALDPKARVEAVDRVDAPEAFKSDVKEHAKAEGRLKDHVAAAVPGMSMLQRTFSRKGTTTNAPNLDASSSVSPGRERDHQLSADVEHRLQTKPRASSDSSSAEFQLVDSHGHEIPIHDVGQTVAQASQGRPETAAQRRRRLARKARAQDLPEDEIERSLDEDGSRSLGIDDMERVLPLAVRTSSRGPVPRHRDEDDDDDDDSGGRGEEETAAERKRRLAALGEAENEESDSEDEPGDRVPKPKPRQESEEGKHQQTGPRQNHNRVHISLPDVRQPPRAHVRDRIKVDAKSPIEEEEEEGSGKGASAGQGLDGASQGQTGSENPRSPGIRFAEMPRGEGKGRTTRWGRTMGMHRSRK